MLKVSRSDIVTDRIVELEHDSRRFLKLPVAPYLELLEIEPNNPQRAIINAVNNPKYRFITAAVSRRVGKTYISNIVGQLVALVPGCHILIMSPNYGLSQISFDLQKQLINYFDLEVTRSNAKDKVIELSNGSTIRMGSVNQVDSCVGRSYDLIIFDEAALSDGEEAFNVSLRPTLDKENSKAIFISTPRGRANWFHTFFQRGFSDDFPNWVSIHADYHENPRVSEEDIEEAKKSMSEAYFSQEYLASFNVFEGRIYKFNHENCIKDLSHLDLRKMDVIAGLDIGYNDPTSFIVLAYDWDTGNYYALKEYHNAERNTEQHAAYIRDIINQYDIDFVFADPAAAQFRADLAGIYDIPTIKAKKSVNDGISFVSSIIEHDRLIVDENCGYLLQALEGYHWDPNPNLIKEKPKHDYSDMADALRYALYSFVTSGGIF